MNQKREIDRKLNRYDDDNSYCCEKLFPVQNIKMNGLLIADVFYVTNLPKLIDKAIILNDKVNFPSSTHITLKVNTKLTLCKCKFTLRCV